MDTTMHTSEGTTEDRETYLHQVYPVVECSFTLWYGTARKGRYQSAPVVRYERVTREQALSALVYALNTGEAHVNPQRQSYSDLHTKGIEE